MKTETAMLSEKPPKQVWKLSASSFRVPDGLAYGSISARPVTRKCPWRFAYRRPSVLPASAASSTSGYG